MSIDHIFPKNYGKKRMMKIITALNLPGVVKVAGGKVREIFEMGDRLLIVATDRISAFDVVLPSGIPHKGLVLTQLSKYWFEFLGVKNHMISTRFEDLPKSLAYHRDDLEGRFMIVKKLEMVPVECVVRGYLAGSGFKDYQRAGAVCGVTLPAGLKMAEKLPEPIFTPAAKATSGHDENISFRQMADRVGADLAGKLRDLSVDIYRRAADHARERGVIIADTKFEFGLDNGEIILADEVLTPDSSRYWPEKLYRAGESPPSFDKQFVRDYLAELDWDRTPPAPELPGRIVQGISERYIECHRRLVGKAPQA